MKKRVIAIAAALLLIAALIAACSDNTKIGGGDTVTLGQDPVPLAGMADEAGDVIDRAYANYVAFREYLSLDNIYAVDVTREVFWDDEIESGESSNGYNVDKWIINGRYGKNLSGIYNAEDVLTDYNYIEREGEDILNKKFYNILMTDEQNQLFTAIPEVHFDGWVKQTYINFISNVKMNEIDINYILDAEITETDDGLTVTTLTVDPMGTQNAMLIGGAALDYTGSEPRMNTSFGDYIVITLTTDENGTPVSNSEWVHLVLHYMGEWGENTPEVIDTERLSVITYNAFNGDVDIVFPE